MTALDLKRAAEAMPAVRLVRGDTVKLEPVRWLWPGFLPAGMLTVLGGAPGCGKTTIALSMAAVITHAGRWPDGVGCSAAGDVLVWSGEDGQSVTAARLKAAGANMQRVHFIDSVTGEAGGPFDPARDMPLLEAAAAGLAAPRLLIVDPIVSAVAGDSHRNAEVRRDLQPVVDLAQRLGCAVLGITHFTKGTTGRDPVERITGSLAFAALARLVLVAAKIKPAPGKDDADRRVLSCSGCSQVEPRGSRSGTASPARPPGPAGRLGRGEKICGAGSPSRPEPSLGGCSHSGGALRATGREGERGRADDCAGAVPGRPWGGHSGGRPRRSR